METEDNWQPIETAPKDGTEFLGAQNRTVFLCTWSKELYPLGSTYEGWVNAGSHNYDDGGDWRMNVTPTHWQPLPEPPSKREKIGWGHFKIPPEFLKMPEIPHLQTPLLTAKYNWIDRQIKSYIGDAAYDALTNGEKDAFETYGIDKEALAAFIKKCDTFFEENATFQLIPPGPPETPQTPQPSSQSPQSGCGHTETPPSDSPA